MYQVLRAVIVILQLTWTTRISPLRPTLIYKADLLCCRMRRVAAAWKEETQKEYKKIQNPEGWICPKSTYMY